MNTGPVTMWGPSTPNRCGIPEAAIARASASTSDGATPKPAKKASGSRPWSQRIPSWLTVSKVTVAPESILRTGLVRAFGSSPHLMVSGVEGR
ncbi:hypothetical protein [Frankia sp. KB5]|uniref:hypothetical protein n=1 Tax=Frankia sp. KB5 TaxID=683318 RepID=UPI001F5315AC|nr:hypothetical protein [Frankia sp. KB5]